MDWLEANRRRSCAPGSSAGVGRWACPWSGLHSPSQVREVDSTSRSVDKGSRPALEFRSKCSFCHQKGYLRLPSVPGFQTELRADAVTFKRQTGAAMVASHLVVARAMALHYLQVASCWVYDEVMGYLIFWLPLFFNNCKTFVTISNYLTTDLIYFSQMYYNTDLEFRFFLSDSHHVTFS